MGNPLMQDDARAFTFEDVSECKVGAGGEVDEGEAAGESFLLQREGLDMGAMDLHVSPINLLTTGVPIVAGKAKGTVATGVVQAKK